MIVCSEYEMTKVEDCRQNPEAAYRRICELFDQLQIATARYMKAEQQLDKIQGVLD
jgi:hypothetical protein